MVTARPGPSLSNLVSYATILCAALCLAVCLPEVSEAQDNSLRSSIVEVLKAYQPSWRVSYGIESGRSPLVPSEKTILVAEWISPNPNETTDVHIYEVGNPSERADWLRPNRTNQVAPGWRISTYQIGDE